MVRALILITVFLGSSTSGPAWSEEKPSTPPADQILGGGAPPPGLSDPGVVSTAEDVAAATESTVAGEETLQPVMPDTSAVRPLSSRKPTPEQIAANSDSITERKEGSDTVKEYRKNGLLQMVHVVPENGVEQMYYDNNGDGRLDRDLVDGPVSPVYFSVYQWD